MTDDEHAELARLRSENDKLRAQAAQAEAAVEILENALERLEGLRDGSISEQDHRPSDE